MHYKHLTQEERYHIYEGRAISKSLRKIAKELKRDVSTLSRETRRNRGERGIDHARHINWHAKEKNNV